MMQPLGCDRRAVASRKQCRATPYPLYYFCQAAARVALGLVGLGLFFVCGCGPVVGDGDRDGRLAAIAGIPPLRYLVEQIGGEHVKVSVLVQPGQDPHTFEPTPQQVVSMAQAAVVFKSDMPFEAVIIEKVREGNRRLVVVEVTEGIRKLPLVGPCCEESGHDGHVTHHADEFDPHVWLSPPLLNTMAANITEGLCQADPAHAKDYRHNLSLLDLRLDRLHQQVGRKLAPYRGRSFYVFHPGFTYFADAYGLKEKAIQLGGQMPTGKHLLALIEEAKAEGVKTVFVQPEFDPQRAQAVADALGGHVVQINGLGENVIADIEDIAMKIERAVREGSPQKTRDRRKTGSEK
jgi:zinc transport system substrate-binding protein